MESDTVAIGDLGCGLELESGAWVRGVSEVWTRDRCDGAKWSRKMRVDIVIIGHGLSSDRGELEECVPSPALILALRFPSLWTRS